jgi:hypothetical protein
MGNNPINGVDPDGGFGCGGANEPPCPEGYDTTLINDVIPMNITVDYKAIISFQYGVEPYEWAGYLNRSGGAAIMNIYNTLGHSGNTSSSELYTLSVGEGFYFAHLSPNGYDLNKTVNGFNALGVDHFGSERDNLVAGGYLSSSFNLGDEYELDSRGNEWGQTVSSAKFNNIRSGLTAFSAVMNRRRDLVTNHGADFGYGAPTEDQLFFWTYYYFQGEGRGQKFLRDNGSWDISGMNFDVSSKNPKGVGSLSYRRLATWRYIQLKTF